MKFSSTALALHRFPGAGGEQSHRPLNDPPAACLIPRDGAFFKHRDVHSLFRQKKGYCRAGWTTTDDSNVV